jgi:hypothetical protein
MIDLSVRVGARIDDVQISKLRTFYNGLAGGSALLFRGPGTSSGLATRINLDNANMWSPFEYAIANGLRLT